ncbi:MAG: hypothetical protein U5N58_01650 [Actinomycetota bacterium]|nr:hypothetical protein [Actinomycetota bacterium]
MGSGKLCRIFWATLKKYKEKTEKQLAKEIVKEISVWCRPDWYQTGSYREKLAFP